MKTKTLLTLFAAGAALTVAPLRAEEAKPAMKCAGMKEMDKKMQAMEAKMKAEAAEFDKLVNEMNASIGDKKIEVMAAIINKMAQKQKEMKAKCDAMMKGGTMMGMMKKDEKPEAKPVKVDYYTCTMHPQVHWPVPGKCPLCSMELVPVVKKEPGAKPEAKPGEEPKKADDPHAGHH